MNRLRYTRTRLTYMNRLRKTQIRRIFMNRLRYPRTRLKHIATNAISELKRGSQRRKSVYLANTSLVKAKTRLPSESVPRKGGNFFTTQNLRRKSLSRAKTHINERIRVYIAKTERRKRVYRAKENVPRKGGNAFTERKRRKQRRKRVYQWKTRLRSENAFPERKRGSQNFKRRKGDVVLPLA